jgi:hypothetical protein
MSKTLLGQVRWAKRTSGQTSVTLDGNRFLYPTDYQSISFSKDQKAPKMERMMIASQQLMLTFVWNPDGFHVVDVLRKGTKFCSAYQLSRVMDFLLAALQPDDQHSFPKLVIHADNACVHTSNLVDEYFESHRLQRANYLPFSQDRVPVNLFLFRFVEGQLKRTDFPDGQEFICALKRILSDLPPEMLRSTSDAWSDVGPLAEISPRTEYRADPDSL